MRFMSRPAQIVAANELVWLAWTTHAATAPVPGWLRARGLDPQAITRSGHMVGQAGASWSEMTDLLARHRVPTRVALDAGLLRRAESGRVYDGFRNRVVLPVRDVVGGRIVGFTARRVDDTDPRTPKYLNSPASCAYRKGDLLFGAWEARQALTRDRAAIAHLVVCEGPFDVLNVAATGRWAALAPCGTALTPSQAGWIVAMARAFDLGVQVAFDADPPGQAAADRAWDLLVSAGVPDLRLADLPAGTDPGELSAAQLETALTPPLRR